MRLWLLERKSRSPKYDTSDGFVIRAETEGQARAIANRWKGDEGPIWTNPEQASCEPLDHDGQPGIVLRDFNAG